MLYLIGLGLNEKSLSAEALYAVKKCYRVYLENYTVNFPYSIEMLEKIIGKKIISLERKEVESDKLVKEAIKEDVALLIYGSPLFATTHLSLLLDAKKIGVKTKVVYNASVFDAIASCGLELYKFGKITSMPKLIVGKFEPDSFMDIVKENQSINAHSLILCDIGLEFKDAIDELEKSATNKKINLDKIIVCSQLGTFKQTIIYDNIEKLKSKNEDGKNKIGKGKIEMPFCIIIPAVLHFIEKEALEKFSE